MENMKSEYVLWVVHPNSSLDDVDNITKIVFPIFGKRGDGMLFSSRMKSRLYLNGNHAFFVRVCSALKNNGYSYLVGEYYAI